MDIIHHEETKKHEEERVLRFYVVGTAHLTVPGDAV